MNKNKPVLEVKNLCMRFKNTGKYGKQSYVKAIDDVSFDIYPNEVFGLVGESGCGKTTMGRTILRLHNPTSGEMFYNGKCISGKMTNKLRKYLTDNIAMIFQDPIASLNPRMTVQEIIGEGLKTRGIKSESVRNDLVNDVLQKVGLQSEHATRYPHEFSGGQRQRIGIARALIVKPSMIIADEPTSALDVSIQAQVINLLQEIKEHMELTILFIAHNLSIVKYFSDRIGVMYFGKLVEVAPSEVLFRNPLHPYTKSLFSAIPEPDPITERKRKHIYYDPTIHNYSAEKPFMYEISPNHFIYASNSELEKYREELCAANKS